MGIIYSSFFKLKYYKDIINHIRYNNYNEFERDIDSYILYLNDYKQNILEYIHIFNSKKLLEYYIHKTGLFPEIYNIYSYCYNEYYTIQNYYIMNKIIYKYISKYYGIICLSNRIRYYNFNYFNISNEVYLINLFGILMGIQPLSNDKMTNKIILLFGKY